MIDKQYGISISHLEKYGFKLSLEVYKKYEGKCNICGNVNNLAIHHKNNKGRHFENQGLEPDNSIDNLELLCRSCHNRLHAKQQWSEKIAKQGGYKYYNREKEYQKELYQKNKKYFQEYYKKNKITLLEKSKAYAKKNRAKINLKRRSSKVNNLAGEK